MVTGDKNVSLATQVNLSSLVGFPIELSTKQKTDLQKKIDAVHVEGISSQEISELGVDVEKSLHEVLDSFLSKINQCENPRIFDLFTKLSEGIDKEKLPELADRILNGKLSMWGTVKGMFSKESLVKAKERAWEETRNLASGKTKTLVSLVKDMEHELVAEQQRLGAEIQNLEQLKNIYRERFSDFAVTVVFVQMFLERFKMLVSETEKNAHQDPVQKAELDELHDKLHLLESRTLALEGILTRLPADQLVIRQLNNAGIATLQETTTTALARFASMKMTLLALHGAMITKGVQQLTDQGAALDVNLSNIRNKLVLDVVARASNAPGDNRLAQAEQIRGIVANSRELVTIAEQSRANNIQKFAQAKQMFELARKDMLMLGKEIRLNQPLNQ